jgi:hypothetical protein
LSLANAQAASKAPAISVKKKAQQSPAAPAAARPTEELKMVRRAVL